MLSSLLIPLAAAAPPRGEFLVDGGIVASQLGFTVGLGGRSEGHLFSVVGSATFGPRVSLSAADLGASTAVAFTTTTVAIGPTQTTRTTVRIAGHLDTAVLDRAERGCVIEQGCRHELWIGDEGLPVGLSLAPGGGIRLARQAPDRRDYALLIAIQATASTTGGLGIGARLDLGVALTERVTFHTYMGRYGSGIGLGVALSPPPRGDATKASAHGGGTSVGDTTRH